MFKVATFFKYVERPTYNIGAGCYHTKKESSALKIGDTCF